MHQLPRRFTQALLAAVLLFPTQHSPAKTDTSTTANLLDSSQPNPSASANKDVAAEKFWQAITLLNNKKDEATGRSRLQEAADLEFTHAQTLLAECLITGQYGFTKDHRKAASLYRLAAERGNAYAQVSLGQCYYTGTGVRKNREKAAEWLNRALTEKADFTRPIPPPEYFAALAEKQNNTSSVAGAIERDPVSDCKASANYLLGLITSADKKTDQAHKYFVVAATAGIDGRSGIYPAAVQAALNYAFGQGTARDMAKANEMLAISRRLTISAGMRRVYNYTNLKIVDDFATGEMEEMLSTAGEKFQTSMQVEIADSFAKKNSKDYNPAEAVKWYELASESGNVAAMIKLGCLHAGNELGKQDFARSFLSFKKAGGGETPKHFLGLANLAICYFNGIGTTRDSEAAAALFNKFKKKEFICYLGSRGECPKTILTPQHYRELLETWAKDQKDPQAQYFLGTRYRDAWDGTPDIKAAIRWFKKAADKGHGPSLGALGTLHASLPTAFEESGTEAVANAYACFKKGSEAGDAESMANYATLLTKGQNTGPGADAALPFFEQSLAIDPTNVQANNNIAVIYEARARDTSNGNARHDLAQMFQHYEAAVQQKDSIAARNLGMIYAEGWLIDQDWQKAYRYFEQAAEWGLPDAHFILGKIHELGCGVPITYSEAAYHYRLAALDGHLDALKKLIQLYICGRMGSVDFDRAMFWLDRLARLGDLDALTSIADIMMQKKDYPNMLKILNLLEENGRPAQIGFACERFSRCYEQGLGVKINLSRSKRYFERALENNDGDALARQGLQLIKLGKIQDGISVLKQAANYSANACFALGELYFTGSNIELDQDKALKFMRKAAEQNHFEALYFLAKATCDNVQGAPSLDEAILFANQAEVCGLEKAKALREQLEIRRDKKIIPTSDEEAARVRSS
ncbi:MAG: tetratricopeptide repeat protein [Nibricoccus sp.]